jgi:tetratricopeptide (TPR) repeat protein
MFATSIWRRSKTAVELSHARQRKSLKRAHLSGWILIFAGLCLAATPLRADEPASETNYVALVGKEFHKARSRFQAETNSAEAAWQFGRACFDWAGFLKDPTQIGEVAKEGIAACRTAITNAPASAPAHYYLGMTLGRLADTKRNLAALRMVREMEREFKKALELDERFSFAGPDRNLGLLYWQAPVIGSIGSRSKARQHLRRAVELAPDYPENRLNLIEAFSKWGDSAEARIELRTLEETWAAAQRQFAGLNWAASRLDWEKRLNKARRKLQAGQGKGS